MEVKQGIPVSGVLSKPVPIFVTQRVLDTGGVLLNKAQYGIGIEVETQSENDPVPDVDVRLGQVLLATRIDGNRSMLVCRLTALRLLVHDV